MADLAAFFEALDQQAHDLAAEQLHDPGSLERGGAINEPTFRRWAERAGVELEAVVAEARGRMVIPATVMSRRVEAEQDTLVDALNLIGAAAAIQFFLAGVLWEQGRGMPDVTA